MGLLTLLTQSMRRLALGGVLMATVALYGQAQKNWKDTAEYELYVSFTKATAPDQQIQILNQWKEKYPESEYKLERAQAYLSIYGKKNDGAGLFQASKDLLAIDPKSYFAMYYMTVLTESLNRKDAEGLATGQKAANSLIALLPEQFDPAKKPNNVTEAQWKEQRVSAELAAIKTLGWIELQKKNFKEAEKLYVKGLELSPGTAQFSSLLGTAIAYQKDPKRQAEAMWHFARAGNLDGPGALDPTAKAQTAAYFSRTYTGFAGDDKKEMNEIIEKAKANVFPPADFKIISKEEKMAQDEEKFKASNPSLFQYMQIKKALLAPEGDGYWGSLKDSELPTFKGKLVSTKPETNPKEIVLAIESADQPEVTLMLEKPLRGKAEPGTEIEFTGVVKEFTKDPYTLKLEVENEKLKGWPAQGPAPKTPVKKGPAAVKKGVKK